MQKITLFIMAISFFTLPLPSLATTIPVDNTIAISAYLGGRFSENLNDIETGQETKIDNNLSQALALSWYYEPNTEGELFYSNSKHSFNMSGHTKNAETDIYISYLHFGGRINFTNETPLSSSLGLGVGSTFFISKNSQYDNDIALSGSVSWGLRYELSDQWAVKADLRIYGTVLQNNSALLCSNNQCLVKLDGEVHVQTDLMVGIEYKF